MIFLMDMPVVSWRWWATASEVMTMVRWATGGVALVVEDGAGFQVVLLSRDRKSVGERV